MLELPFISPPPAVDRVGCPNKVPDVSSQSLRRARREDELARRRADTLAAAASIFAARGYHDTQITDIAAAAELSRASLYAMFDGKEGLYLEVISNASEAIRESVRRRVESLDDPGQRLLAVIDSLLACWEENQTLLQLYALAAHGLPFHISRMMGESTHKLFVEFTDWVISLAEEAQRGGYLRGHDPQAVGIAVVGAVTTRATRWIEAENGRPLTEAGAPDQEDAPEDDAVRSRPGNILLVEDRDSVRRITKSILANAGHEVFEARTGSAAIEMATPKRPMGSCTSRKA